MNLTYWFFFIKFAVTKNMHSVILANTPDVKSTFRTSRDVALCIRQVPDYFDCLSVHCESVEHLCQTERIEEEDTSFGESKDDIFLLWVGIFESLLYAHLMLSLIEYLCVERHNITFLSRLYNLHARHLL